MKESPSVFLDGETVLQPVAKPIGGRKGIPARRGQRRKRRHGASPVGVPPYSLRFDWDPHDRIFVVSVPELDGCRTHGATYEEAVANAREAIASWVGALALFGDPVPEPRAVRHSLTPTGD